jgi:hypothetical protein
MINVHRLTRRPATVAGFAVLAVAAAAIGGSTIAAAEASSAAAGSGQLVIIDANTDHAGALDALKLADGATDLQFTPTTAASYGTSTWSPVTDASGNLAPSVTGSDEEVDETLEVTHEQSSSWSLGGSIEASVGFDLLDTVDAELSTKFTANHTWEKATTDSETIDVTALPGKTVWIEASNSTATYTGDFAFDINGAHYEVDNVTISQPATSNTGTEAAAAYRVEEAANTDLGITAHVNGLTHINALPKLRRLIAAHS